MALLMVLLVIFSAPSSFASSASEPWLDPRLPKSLKPIQYDLFIQPRIYDRRFNGQVSIEITVLNRTNFIIVHAELNVSNTRVFVNGTSRRFIRAFSYARNFYWVVETEQPMMIGDMVKLDLEFWGHLQWYKIGVTKTGFTDENTKRHSPAVVTLFKPSYARLGFPNFDEPSYKSEFTITLLHWANLTAVSNMPEDTVTNIDGDWRETKFRKTPPISSYAVGFVIGEFVSRNETLRDGKLHRVWARPERVHRVDFTLRVTRFVANFLSRELGSIAQLPKIDHIAVPYSFDHGGHAHWGLINHHENRLTFNSTLVGVKHRQRELVVIATELARIYFGTLVNCEYWHHEWLDSGLARFYGLKAAATMESISHQEQEFKEAALFDDAFNNSRPLVDHAPNNTDEPIPKYKLLLLSKGAAVLKMMENFLGARTFKDGIKLYIERHEFKTAMTWDLFAAMQSVVGASPNITEIMNPWVYSMGYPIITIEVLSDQRISAKQKRFLMDPSANPNYPPSADGYKWHVPLNYRTKRGNTGLVWMNKTDAVFENLLNADDNWIIFNHDQIGYYHVNYSRQLWDNIAEQLKNDHEKITYLDRTQLLGDALNIATAEQLGFDVALNLTLYASKEPCLSAWTHIYKALENVNQMLSNTSDFTRYQRYVLNITTNPMNKLKVLDEGTAEEILLRPKIMSLSCSVGHRGCIDGTTRLFKAWIQSDKLDIIPVNFRREAMCHGIANSANESEWNITFTRFLAEKKWTAASDTLILGLACTRNLTLIRRILEMSLSYNNASASNNTVRKFYINDLTNAIQVSRANPEVSVYIWEWLKANRAQIDKRFYRDTSAELAYEVTYNFNTAAQLQDVRQFFAGMNSTQAKSIQEETDQRIKANIRSMNVHHAAVSRWLQQNFPV